MKKMLIAVNNTKSFKKTFQMCNNICSAMQPESTIVLYVEKFEGKSLIDEMLGDAEMQTLKEVLEGTEYKEALDLKASKIVNYYKKAFEDNGVTGVKALIKEGHPAEEILKTAKEEDVDLIVIGSGDRGAIRFVTGSVSREVVDRSEVPVLVGKG